MNARRFAAAVALGIGLLLLGAACWHVLAAPTSWASPWIEIDGVPASFASTLVWPAGAGAWLALAVAILAVPLLVLLPVLIVGAVAAAALLLVLALVAGVLALVLSPLIVVMAAAWLVWRVLRGPRPVAPRAAS